MNPACHQDLFQNGGYIGELAHIIPHADGGNVTPNNLIVLCGNCHTTIDSEAGRTQATIRMLRNWKSERNRDIRAKFSRQCETFADLREAVLPALRRNRAIFESYGPQHSPDDEHLHPMWLMFEPELIANNEKLVLLFDKNRHLFHRENANVVDRFSAHAREFTQTRDKADIVRVNLFPNDLHSIFGLTAVRSSPPTNLSALQNFVSYLISTERFITLQLVPDPILTYRRGKDMVELDLNDRPRILQIYWGGKFYRPQTTDLRLRQLMFFLGWLYQNGIEFTFPDYRKLIEIRIADKHHALLCYKYCLSLADLHDQLTPDVDIVINLHHWGGGRVSEQAVDHASQRKIKLMSQREFFVYAHNELICL